MIYSVTQEMLDDFLKYCKDNGYQYKELLRLYVLPKKPDNNKITPRVIDHIIYDINSGDIEEKFKILNEETEKDRKSKGKKRGKKTKR